MIEASRMIAESARSLVPFWAVWAGLAGRCRTRPGGPAGTPFILATWLIHGVAG